MDALSPGHRPGNGGALIKVFRSVRAAFLMRGIAPCGVWGYALSARGIFASKNAECIKRGILFPRALPWAHSSNRAYSPPQRLKPFDKRRFMLFYKDKLHMEALNRLPWTAKDPIFERLAQISEISALTRDERIKYDAAIRYYRDNAHALEDAEEVGRKKGFIETAKKLKAMGMSTSDIHIVTGLLPEDIDKL